MLHYNKPQRKSLEGLRTDDEYVHPLYVDTFDRICIRGDHSTVSGGLMVQYTGSEVGGVVSENHRHGLDV